MDSLVFTDEPNNMKEFLETEALKNNEKKSKFKSKYLRNLTNKEKITTMPFQD